MKLNFSVGVGFCLLDYAFLGSENVPLLLIQWCCLLSSFHRC